MCLLPIKLIPGECTSLSLIQSHITAWRQLLRCVQTSAASGHVHEGVENPNPVGVENLKHAAINEKANHAGVGNTKHAMFPKESTQSCSVL